MGAGERGLGEEPAERKRAPGREGRNRQDGERALSGCRGPDGGSWGVIGAGGDAPCPV